VADETRSRTIAWKDPVESAKAGLTLSGLDYLRKMASGELPRPPIGILMDFSIVEVEKGKVTFAVQPAEFHYNPIGVVHGGLAATLCDSAMGCAVQTMLPAGTGYTTVDLSVTYLRPLTRETGLYAYTGYSEVTGSGSGGTEIQSFGIGLEHRLGREWSLYAQYLWFRSATPASSMALTNSIAAGAKLDALPWHWSWR